MLAWLYIACLLLLSAYGANSFLLTLIYWFKKPSPPTPLLQGEGGVPVVTVQLPIFNERYVVERLLGAVSRLDWPAGRLQIQVLDDSTDETRAIVDRVAEQLRAGGTWIEVLRRRHATGFKGGALAAAMSSVRGEFIAIFDADFLPPRDFLARTLLAFADPRIGCAQARWGHVNADYSLFTQVQTAGIDGHFIVEQEARNRMGWFMSFNGSAGVWRKACIESAGGWSGDTLTEDLDLSFRAQMAGWRFKFLSDVVAPAELPAQIDAYKRQQFRWAKGSVQTIKKLLPSLWRARLPLMVKVQGTLQLSGYLMHPLMFIAFLLAVPIAFIHAPVLVLLPYLMLALVGHLSMYGTALIKRARDERPTTNDESISRQRRFVLRPSSLVRMPGLMLMLVILGTGMSINNTRAALEALLGIRSGFRRTPKFALRARGDRWHAKPYALTIDPIVWAELTAALLACAIGIADYLSPGWQVGPWILIYAGGYSFVASLSLWQGLGRELAMRA